MQKSFCFMLMAAACTLSACQREANPDMADYEMWRSKPGNARSAEQLQAYLNGRGVGQVFPLYQLLRSDTRWQRCGGEPFTVPPKALWPNIVPTLRVVRDSVVPRIGPVEALSVFRTPKINNCIKGASKSVHMQFQAIDMKPIQSIERDIFVRSLCKLYRSDGIALNMGLGVYKGSRFHIDAAGYRSWGSDHRAASSPCRPVQGNQR